MASVTILSLHVRDHERSRAKPKERNTKNNEIDYLSSVLAVVHQRTMASSLIICRVQHHQYMIGFWLDVYRKRDVVAVVVVVDDDDDAVVVVVVKEQPMFRQNTTDN